MRTLWRFLITVVAAASLLAAGLALVSRPARSMLAAGSTRPGVELTELAQRSVVYDRYGSVLAVLHEAENRSPVALDAVPAHVVTAILDVEDDAFWHHDGVNVRAILRAALTNAREGDVVQGGSTITQQLVKNALLTPERDITRKVKEAVLAVRLEAELDKRAILEAYLNTVYFGNGAYGVQAASEVYFGKNIGELDVAEGAFLAGVIRNPVGYNPFGSERVRQAARSRRDFALDRMVVEGHLAAEQAEAMKGRPIPEQRFDVAPTRDNYFVEEVKQRLLDHRALGETYQERYNALFRGGLAIHTTFDPFLQAQAEKAVQEETPDTGGRFTSALVAVEPTTGAVRAMVGGPGWEQAKYNLATGRGGSGRQPGSSFKPIVLATAFEEGFGPDDTIDGRSPCSFPARLTGSGEDYRPENYEGSRGGYGPLRSATAKSLNCAFVRLGLAFDKDPASSLGKVADMAGRLGIKGDVDPVLAMPLGSEEVTPLEMASAYGVFAADGVRHDPVFVDRVLDRHGREVIESRTAGKRVVKAQTARLVTDVLGDVVRSGTGTRARLSGRPVAGKTGTSQEWRDAWFVGYTPQLVAAVWMGAPSGQVSMRNVGGVRVTGGSYPARIWKAFMAEAMDGLPVMSFTAPDRKLIPKRTTIRPLYDGAKYRSSSTRRSTANGRPPATTAATTATSVATGGAERSEPSPPPTEVPTPVSPGGSPPPPGDPGGDGGGGSGAGDGGSSGGGNGGGSSGSAESPSEEP